MIKLIHRYKQSIGIVFLFIAFCFAVSGVTVDLLQGTGGSRSRYAVKVNDREYSFEELRRAETKIESRFKQMLGDNYYKLARSLQLDLPQQALDNLIDEQLITESARKVGFAAGDDEIKRYVANMLTESSGGEPITADTLRAMIRNSGLTVRQFEETLKGDIVRSAYTGLLTDVGFATERDIKARREREETKYSFVAARLSAESLTTEVPTPADADLQKFYEANATDYEVPARVSYDYIVFDPKDFEKEVSVSPQDVELFYTDNLERFAIPQQVKIRTITLLYPKDPDPVKMANVRERAKKAYDEAVSNKPFESLVTLYSDDLPSKAAGGLRGWLTKEAAPKEYGDGVFQAAPGTVAPLIETDYGFEIVKVEEKKEAGQKTLDESRGEIEKEIRSREAPAYAAAKARELTEAAKSKKTPLAELATSANLKLASSAGLLSAEQDPTPQLTGLSRQILDSSTADRALPMSLDVGETTIMVQVKESKDSSTAPFAEVKDRVIAAFKAGEAKKLAEKRTTELLEMARASAGKQPPVDLKTVALEKKFVVEGPFDVSHASPSVAGFEGLTPEMRDALFATKGNGQVVDRYFTTPKGLVLVQVKAITKPDPSAAGLTLEKYRAQASQEMARAMVDSNLALIKADPSTTIDVNPSAMKS